MREGYLGTFQPHLIHRQRVLDSDKDEDEPSFLEFTQMIGV